MDRILIWLWFVKAGACHAAELCITVQSPLFATIHGHRFTVQEGRDVRSFVLDRADGCVKVPTESARVTIRGSYPGSLPLVRELRGLEKDRSYPLILFPEFVPQEDRRAEDQILTRHVKLGRSGEARIIYQTSRENAGVVRFEGKWLQFQSGTTTVFADRMECERGYGSCRAMGNVVRVEGLEVRRMESCQLELVEETGDPRK